MIGMWNTLDLAQKDGERSNRLIRDHVLASQQQLEGGGLMLPLDERPSFPSPSKPSTRSSLARAQGDAAGDEDEDDEDDEDAIK